MPRPKKPSRKPKPSSKQFVYCFQKGLGFDVPFLAELLDANSKQATLKVGRKQIKAHRGACSTTPYSEETIKKYQPQSDVEETKTGKKRKSLMSGFMSK